MTQNQPMAMYMTDDTHLGQVTQNILKTIPKIAMIQMAVSSP